MHEGLKVADDCSALIDDVEGDDRLGRELLAKEPRDEANETNDKGHEAL